MNRQTTTSKWIYFGLWNVHNEPQIWRNTNISELRLTVVLITLYICDAPSNFQQNGFVFFVHAISRYSMFSSVKATLWRSFLWLPSFCVGRQKCSVKCTYSGDDESHHFITRTEHKLKWITKNIQYSNIYNYHRSVDCRMFTNSTTNRWTRAFRQTNKPKINEQKIVKYM